MKSSLYSLLCIVVRTYGLFVAGSALFSLPEIWMYADPAPGGLPISFFVAMTVGTSIVGLLLWVYPRAIVGLTTRRSSHEPFESNIGAADLQRIAFSVVGVCFTMSGVSTLISGVGTYVGVRMMNRSAGIDTLFGTTQLWIGLAIMAAGIALTLGSRALAGLLHTLRTASPAPPPKIEEGS